MHLKLEQKSAKMEHVNKFWQSFVIASYCLHAYHLEVRAQKLLPLEIHRKIWPNLIFIEVIFFCSIKKNFLTILFISNAKTIKVESYLEIKYLQFLFWWILSLFFQVCSLCFLFWCITNTFTNRKSFLVHISIPF